MHACLAAGQSLLLQVAAKLQRPRPAFTHGVEGVSTQVNELGVGLHLQTRRERLSITQCQGRVVISSNVCSSTVRTSASSVPSWSEMILHTSLSTSVLSCTSEQPPVSASSGHAQSSYTPNILLLTTAKVTTLRARTGAATKLTLGACMDTMQRQAGKRYGSKLNQSQLLL